jgi:hypothetical protein
MTAPPDAGRRQGYRPEPAPSPPSDVKDAAASVTDRADGDATWTLTGRPMPTSSLTTRNLFLLLSQRTLHPSAVHNEVPRRGRLISPSDRPAARAWSTFGPHAIGTERFTAVSNGASFAQVAAAILQKQARVQNPDKTPMAVGRHEG